MKCKSNYTKATQVVFVGWIVVVLDGVPPKYE